MPPKNANPYQFPAGKIHPTLLKQLFATRDRLERRAEREYGAGLVPDDLGAALCAWVLRFLHAKHRGGPRGDRFALYPHDPGVAAALTDEACRLFAAKYPVRVAQRVARARARGRACDSLEARQEAIGDAATAGAAAAAAPGFRPWEDAGAGAGETGEAVLQALTRGHGWDESSARALVTLYASERSEEAAARMRARGYADVSPELLRQWRRRRFAPMNATLRRDLWGAPPTGASGAMV